MRVRERECDRNRVCVCEREGERGCESERARESALDVYTPITADESTCIERECECEGVRVRVRA